MSTKLSDLKIRGFKISGEGVSVFLSGGPMPSSKLVTYVNTEADAQKWRGWEFSLIEGGLMMTPPWKGDCAFVPFSNVAFLQLRPAAPEAADKKAVK